MKILMLFALTFLALSGFSQVKMLHTTGNVKDSITNAGADTLHYTLTKSYSTVSIQPTVTKSSGTMAGKSYLYSSVDGLTYILVDSVINSDITTNSSIWTKTSAARYWQIITNGATTVTALVKAYLSAH